LALEEAVAAVAQYADAMFEAAHAAILGELTPEELAAASDPSCPSLFVPQAPKPCARDRHSLAGQPGCAKCRSSGPSEPLLPLARKFTELHTVHAGKVCWTNSDASEWWRTGSHVQMAKLFCGNLGNTHTHASSKRLFTELDGTALFNMLSWCAVFPEPLRGGQGLGQKAVAARNRWSHEGAAHLSLAEAELEEVTANLTELLTWLRDDAGDAHTEQFVAALAKLADVCSTEYFLGTGDGRRRPGGCNRSAARLPQHTSHTPRCLLLRQRAGAEQHTLRGWLIRLQSPWG